jgi:hypothetical protein
MAGVELFLPRVYGGSIAPELALSRAVLAVLG